MEEQITATNSMTLLSTQDLKAAFSVYFADLSIVAIFFDDGRLHLSQNLEHSNAGELRKVTSLYTKSREQAIQQGIMLGGKRYEVKQNLAIMMMRQAFDAACPVTSISQ